MRLVARAGCTGVAKMACPMVRENCANSSCVVAGLNSMSFCA
jgi:hypothetical protein